MQSPDLYDAATPPIGDLPPLDSASVPTGSGRRPWQQGRSEALMFPVDAPAMHFALALPVSASQNSPLPQTLSGSAVGVGSADLQQTQSFNCGTTGPERTLAHRRDIAAWSDDTLNPGRTQSPVSPARPGASIQYKLPTRHVLLLFYTAHRP
ncbi:hypothetical protein SUNI508_06160 [Seiridium unicorne]|uniref:Uncharacterized protein n=1 Tax=Seiridium unicorne TaxID=138068 RepID=A0ABR2V268_9PEZI